MADITQDISDSVILSEISEIGSDPGLATSQSILVADTANQARADLSSSDVVHFHEALGIPEAEFTIDNTDGVVVQQGSSITLSGSATFLGVALTGDELVWHSDIDGLFLYGSSGTCEVLSPGVHTITLMSQFYGGYASLEVTILESRITGDITSVEEDT